jgi:hypothetical protein
MVPSETRGAALTTDGHRTPTNPHHDLHSETGGAARRVPGRARNPLVKVHDLAWLEFTKPDLGRAEAFAHAFGFTAARRGDDELQLPRHRPGRAVRARPARPPLGVRRPSVRAADAADVTRLATAAGTRAGKLDETLGGIGVSLQDPAGNRVRSSPTPAWPRCPRRPR